MNKQIILIFISLHVPAYEAAAFQVARRVFTQLAAFGQTDDFNPRHQ